MGNKKTKTKKGNNFHNNGCKKRITFISKALCLHTPNCKAPKGTRMVFCFALMARSDLLKASEKTLSPTDSGVGSVCLLIVSLLQVEQVQTNGFS